MKEINMQVLVIGLGRMGMNMARRLMQGGIEVLAHNRSTGKIDIIVKEGATGIYDLNDIPDQLSTPRIVWLMLPAGKIVDDHIDKLRELLSPGDIVIEGGNSYYKDDIRRSELLQKDGIHYIDVGVSGGIWGLQEGYCLMYGGNKSICDQLTPIFEALAPQEGHLYCGPAGSGHFVKMVHNGIEYGMMQAYGEGFAILEASPYGKHLDYAKVSHLWNQGSVIRSWLLELAENAFSKDHRLEELSGYVSDSGEGRWTVQQAVESGVSAPVIALSLFNRFQSRKTDAFENRVLAALRREFGGHAVVSSKNNK